MKKAKQLPLEFRMWGGKRRRAGRKAAGPRPLVPHRPRLLLRPGWAAHVTLRVREHVCRLRSREPFAVLERCFAKGKDRFGFRLVHFSVQGNHLHLLVEAPDNAALARGMQGLMVRIAKGLNRLMGRRGAVFADHYHSRPLRSPTEAAHALAYVLGNYARHAAGWGARIDTREPDPFSSAVVGPPAVASPRTWLMKEGWLRGS